MKKILFVCMGMGLGGTEKNLVSALNVLDFTKYDVTLYVRKNRTDLLPLINKSVKIIVNDTPPAFENSIYCKICNIAENLCQKIKLKSFSDKISHSSRKYVLAKRTEYEKKTFFKNSDYDYAVAYDMATEVIKFTLNCVNAKQKIAFYHASKLYDAKMLLYKHFDTIACVNEIVAEDMKSDYPILADKVVAVENFIEPNFVRNAMNDDEPVTRPNNKLVLCSCGRIANVKGFDIAVRAAKMLKDNGIDFHWYFVGSYLDDGLIENLIKTENLQQEITVTGFVSNPYKYTEFCDIYIQPSYEDAHATTVVEAVILNKPIISTNTSTGRLFHDKYGCCNVCDINAEALATSILELYNAPSERERLINATRDFDFSKTRSEYKQAMNDLFDGDEK